MVDTQPSYSVARLPPELFRVFQSFGIQFMHVAHADVASKSVRSVIRVAESGELDYQPGPARVGMLAAADSSIDFVKKAEEESNVVNSLSPRRWDISWRGRGGSATLVEVQFRDKRVDLGDADASVLRLIAVAAVDLMKAAPSRASGVVSWPEVDRRAPVKVSWLDKAVGGLAVAAAVLASVLALRVGPSAVEAMNGQAAQRVAGKARAEATLAHALSVSLGSGDYGLVQSELDHFHRLGYFDSAVVVGSKDRVIALAGQVADVRMGIDLPPTYLATARPIALAELGGREGRLLVSTREASVGSTPSLSPLAWALWLVSLALAGLVLRQLLRRPT